MNFFFQKWRNKLPDTGQICEKMLPDPNGITLCSGDFGESVMKHVRLLIVAACLVFVNVSASSADPKDYEANRDVLVIVSYVDGLSKYY